MDTTKTTNMNKNRDNEEKNELENVESLIEKNDELHCVERSNQELPNDKPEPRALPFTAVMLAAHSEWFKTCFSSGMQESTEQKTLLEFDEKTIDGLRVFMSHKEIDSQIVRTHTFFVFFVCVCVNVFVLATSFVYFVVWFLLQAECKKKNK